MGKIQYSYIISKKGTLNSEMLSRKDTTKKEYNNK